jgi:hypothetical protein
MRTRLAAVGIAASYLVVTAPARAQHSAIGDTGNDNPSTPQANPSEGQAGPSEEPVPSGFETAVRTGYALPMGSVQQNSNLSDVFSGVLPLWFDIGGRIAHPGIFIGAFFQYGIGFAGGSTSNACQAAGGCTLASYKLGAEIHYHFSPEKSFDPWIGYGIGVEVSNVSSSNNQGGGGFSGPTYAVLQVGGDYKPSPDVGIGPFLMLDIGQYEGCWYQGNSSGSCNLSNKSGHQWLTLGLRGVFDTGTR